MFALKQIRSSGRFFMKQLSKTNSELTRVRRIQTRSTLLKKNTEEVIKLQIDGEIVEFPSVWLRDNCQCEKCYHESANSRILDWSRFDLNVYPTHIDSSNNSVNISWNDGHKSQFNKDWLQFRSFTPESQKRYSETIYKPPKITWHGDEFQTVCTKHDYNDILNSEKALYDWLHKFSVYGVALIENTPNDEHALDNIVAKVGFPKQTHYGVKFVVQNIANTSNVAYLSSNLQMHVDLPYYEYCPGVNMLHCLVQTASKGGENLLSDCHYVASFVKENHPETYKLLTDIEVEWSDVGTEHGNEFYKLHRAPVICLDKHGEISRINFSVPQRGSHFPGPMEAVKPWYEAHSLFLELNRRFSARFKTKPGDILVFDNIRLLHGRNAYEDSSENVRKLIGAYVDWDEIYSRLRCLKVKFHKDKGI